MVFRGGSNARLGLKRGQVSVTDDSLPSVVVDEFLVGAKMGFNLGSKASASRC